MKLVDILTPSDTQEIKSGLFIQKLRGDRGYRQVHPAAWNGKINWKTFLFGPGFMKSTIFFLIIIFIVWSYQHDVHAYKEFYEDFQVNRTKYCRTIATTPQGVVFPDWEIVIINGTREMDTPPL